MHESNTNRDDFLDVIQMSQRLEKIINETLHENEIHLAMFALITAAVNSTISQCENIDEIEDYRNLFTKVFDNNIRKIKLKS